MVLEPRNAGRDVICRCFLFQVFKSLERSSKCLHTLSPVSPNLVPLSRPLYLTSHEIRARPCINIGGARNEATAAGSTAAPDDSATGTGTQTTVAAAENVDPVSEPVPSQPVGEVHAYQAEVFFSHVAPLVGSQCVCLGHPPFLYCCSSVWCLKSEF